MRDFWRATRASRSEPFSPPEPITELNTEYEERGITVSADGLEVFFASDRPGGVSEGELDIWYASRSNTDEPFGPAENLAVLNSALDDVSPKLSADGMALYYNHDTQTDGSLDADVWVATRTCEP